MTETMTGIYMVLVVLALIVAALWIVLPFAVFGLKGLVRECIAQQRRTNDLLQQLTGEKRPPSGR